MPCEVIGGAIVCSRSSGKTLGKCRQCWVREATLLCDGPSVSDRGKTCDTPLCRTCAVHVEPNRDFCRDHGTPEKRRLAL